MTDREHFPFVAQLLDEGTTVVWGTAHLFADTEAQRFVLGIKEAVDELLPEDTTMEEAYDFLQAADRSGAPRPEAYDPDTDPDANYVLEEPSATVMAGLYLTEALRVFETGQSPSLVKFLMERAVECLDTAAKEQSEDDEATTTTYYSDSEGNEIGPELIPLVDAAFDLYPDLTATCSRAQIGVALDKTLRALVDLTPDQEVLDELRGLAMTVIEGKLCSHLFPLFVTSSQEHNPGFVPTYWAREIARQVEAEYQAGKGKHYDFDEIADLLIAKAAELEYPKQAGDYNPASTEL